MSAPAFITGTVMLVFRSSSCSTSKSSRRATMKNSTPRMLLAYISILMLPIAAFGQQTAKNPVNQETNSVIALAGRRIDAPDTDPPRFPLQNVPIVRRRLAALFSAEHAEALVCSAACGADLVALEEAERLGLRRRIVLPFPPERFRETSVTDRPGDWGPVFDRLVAAAEAAGDLVILQSTGDDNDAAYAAAVQAI